MAHPLMKVIHLLMPAMEKLTPSCEDISKKISRSLDTDISFRDFIGIRFHTLTCVLCQRYRKQLLNMHELMEKYADEIDESRFESVRLSDNARDRMKKVLAQQ